MAKFASTLHSAPAVLIAAAALFDAAAQAQGLPDPTRPPAAVVAPAGEGDAPAGPVLQSVLITPTRRSAIISGEPVVLGGSYRDAKVVQINEAEVVLKSGTRIETLKLYPAVDRRASQPPAADKKPGREKARRSERRAPRQGE